VVRRAIPRVRRAAARYSAFHARISPGNMLPKVHISLILNGRKLTQTQ
jgi:hypothetical protein